MDLYFRFMVATAFGLVGISQVLTLLIDGLFSEWDAFAELGDYLKELYTGDGRALSLERAEDVMLQIEKDKFVPSSTRLLQQRRAQLREIDEVEYQLSHPHSAAVVLEPILPSVEIIPS